MKKYNNFSNIPPFDIEDCLLEKAYSMAIKHYDKKEIIDILNNDDEEVKPPAIISIESIDNIFELNLVLSHLTNRDGRIRESAAYILNELMPFDFFSKHEQFKILCDAVCDINPNVARNIISFISKSGKLKEKISPVIISRTIKTLDELSVYLKGRFKSNIEKSCKNHAKNKLTFNLYWLMEGIIASNSYNYAKEIVFKTSDFIDYTIREKTAEILSKMDNPPPELLIKLKNDENIYVKNQLL